jgi:hypothetical protein
VEGDTLVVWMMGRDAKEQAITAGKVKGLIAQGIDPTASRFTDTTENLARFVAAAGDSLFTHEALRLEKVK